MLVYMARIVLHEANKPFPITVGDKTVYICQCGLSKTKPYCDGHHKLTLNEAEGKIYFYDAEEHQHALPDMYPKQK